MSSPHLPAEIIEEFYKYWIANNAPVIEKRSYKVLAPGWLAGLRVSRQWRYVALNSGCIWAWAFTQRPDKLESMLQRARGFPLRVIAGPGHPEARRHPDDPVGESESEFPDLVRRLLALNVFDSVETLTFGGSYDTRQLAHDWIYPKRRLSAKKLRFLELNATSERGSHLFSAMKAMMIRHTLHCPLLEEAKFNGVCMPILSKNLRHLEIEMGRCRAMIDTHLLLFCLIKDHASQLEYLRLHDAFESSFQGHERPPMSLERLEVFDFKGTAVEAWQLLRGAHLPRTINMARLSLREESFLFRSPYSVVQFEHVMKCAEFMHNTCNKLRAQFTETPRTLVIDGWRKSDISDSRTSGKLRQRYMTPMLSDFTLTFEFGERFTSWEPLLCYAVQKMRCCQPYDFDLILPPSFDKSGSCKWRYLEFHLGAVVPPIVIPLTES